MVDFDVILGMDWLSRYHDVLDCNAKTVTLAMPSVSRVERKSVSGSYPRKVISFMRSQRLVERGCLSYLAFIRDTSVEPPSMDSVPVVQEFLDVFPFNLPGVPPDRDIDFAIDLEPGKDNVVADALSRKTPSMGSLAALSIIERPLARDVQILANSLVRLQISEESDWMIAFIEARSSLVEQIRAHKFDDEKLCLIRDKVLRGKAKEAVLDSDVVLRIGGRICVSRTGDLIRLILEEAHCSRLTKSAHFIPVQVKYTAEKLAELYISQITYLEDAMEQVRMIQYRLLTAQSRQKSYADRRVRALVFMEGYHVWLRVSPMKGVMSSSCFPSLYASISDESHVISLDSVELGQDLTFEEEPIAIFDRQIRKLRTKEIASVKVQWKHRSVEEATWETEFDMRARYPQLFEASGKAVTDGEIIESLSPKFLVMMQIITAHRWKD
ncbi:uncharacterized protein [Solanum lycopersicum]|uniref:uncharacterized protein n=1 Tax=Solanum lycopersicum TaxID=4081 RepID=UPI00374852F0